MSEREKYRTLGTYYLTIARNYEKAVENFQTLVNRYPADEAGHGNLALAYFNTGNLAAALAGVCEVLKIYPKKSLQPYKYAMYSMYVGDFQAAAKEGERVANEAPTFIYAFLPTALSAAARGDTAAALDTYTKLEQTGPAGARLAELGRADLAVFEGRQFEAL